MNSNVDKNYTSVVALLKAAISEGVPLYNGGNVNGCRDVYMRAAQTAVASSPSTTSPRAAKQQLEKAIRDASQSKDVKEGAWILRHCFDALLLEEVVAHSAGETESLAELLKRTIKEGAPLYNKGDEKGCFDLYLKAAQSACEQKPLAHTAVGQLLEQAIEEATPLGEEAKYGEAAWVLRHCFDDILAQQQQQPKHASQSQHRMSLKGAVLRGDNMVGAEKFDDSSSSDNGYWQDEHAKNTSDFDIGSHLANMAYILRASIQPATHKRFTGKAFDDCFQGSEVVEVLTGLGLAKNRKIAAEKCNTLLRGSFLIPVSHEKEEKFHDGTHLYRFPDREELQSALDRILKEAPSPVGEYREGSMEAQLVVALQNTLELPSAEANGVDGDIKAFSGVSAAHLQPRRFSTMSPEQIKGFSLAADCARIEKVLDIKDRTYRLKKYSQCFIGSDTVPKLLEAGIAETKENALQLLIDLNAVGLIHHVLYDHEFEDKYLFYEFTKPGDLRKSLEAIAIIPNGEPTAGQEMVRHSALINRYKQYADLDVAAILSSFFGCNSQEGWDLVDLQNWRNNMKRWGFGRREDQDDGMVDKLSPLALNVDPETWYDSLSDEEREKWESPWGILAQVAIFDQIPRSAFRGTPDAFKWDPLAIKASKIAIERGYFETAYKSTLNQFLVLLPLEHSESWEDQKLGVTLLLRLLSTVAVQDEGLSDYEIVKRLEFSKRLTTAFLEHAQVIAKFKRYPHRNAPLSRNATLEERVWLASDLVPRWAKSQNPESRTNIIQLPVIPLKRLTRR